LLLLFTPLDETIEPLSLWSFYNSNDPPQANSVVCYSNIDRSFFENPACFAVYFQNAIFLMFPATIILVFAKREMLC
jgi:hypothetical protein